MSEQKILNISVVRLTIKFCLAILLLIFLPLQIFADNPSRRTESVKGNASLRADVKKTGAYALELSIFTFTPLSQGQKQAILDQTGVHLKEKNIPFPDEEEMYDDDSEEEVLPQEEEDDNAASPESDPKRRKVYFLSGGVKKTFSRHGYLISGELDLSALLQTLSEIGIPKLSVSITHPETEYSECTTDDFRENTPYIPDGHHYYTLLTSGDDAKLSAIRIAFGYSTSWVVKRIATLIFLFFLPVFFVSWKRRVILRTGREPMAARFAAFRIVNTLAFTYPFIWWIAGSLLGFRAFWFFYASRSGPVNMVSYFTLYILPPTACILICKALLTRFLESENENANKDSKPKKFLRESVILTFGTLLPWVLLFAGIGEIVTGNWKTALAYFAIGHLFKIASRSLQSKTEGAQAYKLIVAPLRDRIYELAMRAGVNLKEVYIVPENKDKTANACATVKNTVFLNEFLLRKLSRREVDAVIGHEIGHLRLHHPRILTTIWFASILTPMILLPVLTSMVTSMTMQTPRLYLTISSIQRSDLTFPISLAIGSLLFLVVSRRMEYSADAFAATVTGDPEAMITGLIKLSRLNLLPMSWNKFDESLLTHPSSMQRIKALAENYLISPERLETLLNVSDEADEVYSMNTTTEAVQVGSSSGLPAPAGGTKHVKPGNKTRKKPLPVFNLPLQYAFIGLVGGYIIADYLIKKQLTQYGIPKAFFAVVVAGLVFYLACRSLKKKLLKNSPTKVNFVRVEVNQFPALDSDEIARYTAELTALGFEHSLDYSNESDVETTIKGFGRLFIHPSQNCYAEVMQCFSQGLSVTPVYCSITSLIEKEWTLITSNIEPNGVVCAQRIPRKIGECMPNANSEQLFFVHQNFREEAVTKLGTNVAFENSIESYFQASVQGLRESRELVARKNPVAYLYDIHRYDRTPQLLWMGDLSKGNLKKQKQNHPFYEKAQTQERSAE